MVSKVNFSAKQQQKLADILGTLKIICHPPFDDIKPIVKIDKPLNILPSSDGCYALDDLNRMRISNQQLPPHINAIKTNDTTWFYSKDDPFEFYSDKGYVTVNFAPQRLLSPSLLKNKALEHCVQKLLSEAGQKKLSSQEAEKFFPKAICEKVYDMDPPREHILAAVVIAAGEVRRILFQHLAKNHISDLQQLPNFPINSQNSTKDIIEFLKDGQRGFLLAQKWGYITNAQRLIHYQELRDIPRHPSELMPNPILDPSINNFDLTESQKEDWLYHMGYQYQSPTQLYQDFQTALPFVKPQKPKDILSYDDAITTIWAFSEIEQFKKIIASYPREKRLEDFLKKNFPTEISTENAIIKHPDSTQTQEPITLFSSFYVRKDGIAIEPSSQQTSNSMLTFKESDFHNWRTLSNICAHANAGYKESAETLSHDFPFLTNFVQALQEAHEHKKLLNQFFPNNIQNSKS